MKKIKKELIKSIADPSACHYVNDNINPSDYTRDENNIRIPTNVDPNVIRVMDDIIDNNNEYLNNITANKLQAAPAFVKIEPAL